ncbi:MAG TPA: diaminopimelate epimerase [Acidimicrobiales bacterium]|nr:diaminopimelate epimerase [Acidimicrobiales bacterium]
MAPLRLTKHHGLGNDFLVFVDSRHEVPLTAELARALCDRHRGLGADGLIRLGPGTSRVAASMELRNADGGVAEISGNGLRCAGQALVEGGVAVAGEVVVETAVGERKLWVGRTGADGSAAVRAEMGRPRVLGEAPEWARGDVKSGMRVDMGNPHLVLLVADVGSVDLVQRGAHAEASVPGGVNVEFVTPGPGVDELTLRTWERGAGETLACGSGSCAAAVAARTWGLVGERVVVRNPGGPLQVECAKDGTVTLAGPTQLVAVVEVSLEWLAAAPRLAQGGALPA